MHPRIVPTVLPQQVRTRSFFSHCIDGWKKAILSKESDHNFDFNPRQFTSLLLNLRISIFLEFFLTSVPKPNRTREAKFRALFQASVSCRFWLIYSCCDGGDFLPFIVKAARKKVRSTIDIEQQRSGHPSNVSSPQHQSVASLRPQGVLRDLLNRF